ncbi:MAG TPA: hypothetical protein VK978_03625 [Candidatus Saccharimonadales bacterium]|nr:hypothetical protein [Candidatus Saccharimonadales bacterium]
MEADYLAWRLRISSDEATELHVKRQENQRERLSHFVGEYVIDGLGYGGIGLQLAHINALEAHRESLGLDTQVYGGYRGMNFLRDGTLFGPHSNERAREINESNQFNAAQVSNWRDQAGYVANNPFDHMTRGDTPEQRAPILASFAIDLLQPSGDDRKRIPEETALWTPIDGLKIEDTVQIVYHRGKV